MDESMDEIYTYEYDSELDCTCKNSSLALKIGVGIVVTALIGSIVTFKIIKNRKETCN